MICELCKARPANQFHHCFSQTKANVRHYGKKLIDADFNRIPACAECNSSHANIPAEYLWKEPQFRGEAVRAGFTIREPMKSYPSRLRDEE